MPTSPRLEEALAYAARLHRDQVRKGSEVPYVTHLLAVASLVGECGGDEDLMIAGLLHDAVEDQGGRQTLEEIRRRFGERVARIVESCTDTDRTPKPPWRERKELYLRHLREAPPEARLVSAADKVHNLRSILADLRRAGGRVWSRFKGGKEGSLWYHRELSREFLARGPRDLGEEMVRLLAGIESVPGPAGDLK